MKNRALLGLAASLALISAAESPGNYESFGGERADATPRMVDHYRISLSHCQNEAMTPPRGTHETGSLRYSAALRACLYRQGYIDRGSFAYPANLVFDHFFGL